jgi:hypothetical protein
MSFIESNGKSFNAQLESRFNQADSERASIESGSTTNQNNAGGHIARRLFDSDRLDRKLQRHHITCKSIKFMIPFHSTHSGQKPSLLVVRLE